MKKLLLLFLMFLVGCATSEPKYDTGSLAQAEIELTQKGAQKRAQFEKRVEPGMSQDQIVKIAKSIGEEAWFENGQPENRKFEVQNGTKVEVWEYNFYRKWVVLTFEDNKLVRMTTRKAKTVFN